LRNVSFRASGQACARHQAVRLLETGLVLRPSLFPVVECPLPPYRRRSWRARKKKTTKQSMPDLLDASVWLPLSAPDHVHYPRARRYWDDEAASELAFCRVTALALLRHLSNPRILGEAALDGGAAWRALETWLALPLALSCQPSAFSKAPFSLPSC